ncbi:hypothetical protein [Pleionea sp. CnH1-48]|uniref:hypothetical protein n=1 Tax=Pleionea sp. CnH1-48 TaxID=2954494 RepID=UPI002096D44B|nr:hypothetical protein [Pleionea sp. CnH1-48]MCO7224962.1 hypothetical protein [Pleionea sp. CnH1-48]
MTLVEQIKQVLYRAPIASISQLRRSSSQSMLLYYLSSLILFTVFIGLYNHFQADFKQGLLDYLFPPSWHDLTEDFVHFFYAAQAKVVLSNMILSTSLVFASIFLFPLKERFSAHFEKDSAYNNGAGKEFPLILQAWEETKLFLLYLTAQLIILWIGYYPYSISKWLSIILSYLFLFFTFGLDIISPTFQRHRIKYTTILKVLSRYGLVTLLFGVLYSLPMILLSLLIIHKTSFNFAQTSAILFLVNMLFITLAIPAGTHLASQMMATAKKTPPMKLKKKLGVYGLTLMLLGAGLFLHGRLLISIHHKSQILKVEYDIDWSSFDASLPDFSDFISGQSSASLTFDLVINNTSPYDLDFEKSQLIVSKKDIEIGQVHIKNFSVPSGQQKKITMTLDSISDTSSIVEFSDILEDWRIDLKLEVWPGIPFVVNLVESQ